MQKNNIFDDSNQLIYQRIKGALKNYIAYKEDSLKTNLGLLYFIIPLAIIDIISLMIYFLRWIENYKIFLFISLILSPVIIYSTIVMLQEINDNNKELKEYKEKLNYYETKVHI